MSVKADVWNRIRLVQGDITKEQVDAIVNAANQTLLGGGGVDGAIHRAAGPGLLAECEQLGGCPTGSARITKGYNLPARFVIHAVGPVYRDGRHGEPELLAGCYRTAMELARQHGCVSIAFPAISCGVYRYPLASAAAIALTTVAEALATETPVQEVRFVLFDTPAYQTYARVLDTLRAELAPPRPGA